MVQVLLIDDEYYVREAIKTSVPWHNNGFIICGEAEDGEDALHKLFELKPDIALVDINMPIMDGLKLVSIVRNYPNYKDTPIIVIDTGGATEDRERALALGANEYITKPIQTMKILETVKKLMSV